MPMTATITNLRNKDNNAFRAFRAVRGATHIAGPPRAVLYAMASFADGYDGRGVWASQSTLANASGVTERTVRNALNALEGAGAIIRGDQSRAPKSQGGGRSVVVWDLDLDALERGGGQAQESGEGSSPVTNSGHEAAGDAGSNRHLVPVQPAGDADDQPRNNPSEELIDVPPPLTRGQRHDELRAEADQTLASYGGSWAALCAALEGRLSVEGMPAIDSGDSWLLASLESKPSDKRPGFVQSLWLSDVRRPNDEEFFISLLNTGVHDRFVTRSDALDGYDRLVEVGIRWPGRWAESLGLDEGTDRVGENAWAVLSEAMSWHDEDWDDESA
jgi:hypothetical protein